MQQEGAVGIPYERQYGEYSRVLMFMKLFLATADAHVVCAQHPLFEPSLLKDDNDVRSSAR